MPKRLPHNHQNDLFGQTLQYTHLSAPDNPKKAFYKIWLETEFDQFVVKKESGTGTRVLDRRRWVFDTLEDAEKNFER